MTDHDPINHPRNYTSYEGLEVIEQLNFNRGNAVKYIARAGLKDLATELARVEKQQAKTANVSEGDGAVERASDSGLMPSDEALAALREKLTSPATDEEPKVSAAEYKRRVNMETVESGVGRARCGGPGLCEKCGKEVLNYLENSKPKGQLSTSELTKRFGLHKAAIEGENALKMEHATLRTEFMDFATFLNQYLPEGRYKSLVMTELETASMWAHKSIANDSDG